MATKSSVQSLGRDASTRTLIARSTPKRFPGRLHAASSAIPLVTVVDNTPGGISRFPKPEGNFGLPIVGESLEYFGKGPLEFGLERHAKYGGIFMTGLFGAEYIMITDLDISKALLNEDTKLINFDTQGTFAKLQGDFAIKFLGNQDGMRMPIRKVLLTALTTEALTGYAKKIGEITEVQVAEAAKEGSFELTATCRKWGMEYANSLLAGLQGLSPAEAQQVRNDLRDFFEGLITFDIELPGTPLWKALKARDRLMARISAAVKEQLDDIRKEKAPAQPGFRARKNMLGYLIDYDLAQGKEPDTKQLTGLALGVLQAGTDTSSSGFNFLITVLARMPEVFDKVREEQTKVIEQYGPEYTKNAFDSMKYADAVVREALRLNSPAAAQLRVAEKDLQVAGKFIPKGSRLFMNYDAGHALELMRAVGGKKDLTDLKHMDLYNLKESFKPERWLVEKDKQPSIMTFGHGPHTCIGMALYIMEAKAVVAEIARKYDLKLLTGDKITWKKFPGVSPAETVMLSLTPRANALV